MMQPNYMSTSSLHSPKKFAQGSLASLQEANRFEALQGIIKEKDRSINSLSNTVHALKKENISLRKKVELKHGGIT